LEAASCIHARLTGKRYDLRRRATTVNYIDLEGFGEFTGNALGVWKEFESFCPIEVSDDFKAITTTYNKSGPSTGLTKTIDGKAYVAETAVLENRSSDVKTAQGILDLAVSSGWWEKGVIKELDDGRKEVIACLQTSRFRLSSNIIYNPTLSVNMPFTDSDMSHLGNVVLYLLLYLQKNPGVPHFTGENFWSGFDYNAPPALPG